MLDLRVERRVVDRGEDARGVAEARERDLVQAETLDEIVDGQIGCAADEHALTVGDELTDDLDERLGLAGARRTVDESDLARLPQHERRRRLLTRVESLVEEDERGRGRIARGEGRLGQTKHDAQQVARRLGRLEHRLHRPLHPIKCRIVRELDERASLRQIDIRVFSPAQSDDDPRRQYPRDHALDPRAVPFLACHGRFLLGLARLDPHEVARAQTMGREIGRRVPGGGSLEAHERLPAEADGDLRDPKRAERETGPLELREGHV